MNAVSKQQTKIMHYKNGREAKSGDPVVLRDFNNNIQVGLIFDLMSTSDTCNAQLQRPIGQPLYITIKDSYHAEDALLAIDPNVLYPVAEQLVNVKTPPSSAVEMKADYATATVATSGIAG